MVLQRIDNERIILGIDPGTNIMGYGVIKVVSNKAEMVAMGIIDMRKMTDPYLRLGNIFQRVKGIIEEYLPDEMAIEAPFFGKKTIYLSSWMLQMHWELPIAIIYKQEDLLTTSRIKAGKIL